VNLAKPDTQIKIELFEIQGPCSNAAMLMPKAVLFDMDGVLVKSTEAWFRIVESAGTQFRGHKVTREEFVHTR
jgi:hypothetical protein